MGVKSADGDAVLSFDYEVSRHCRTFHVNGAIGGLTPMGEISVSMFTERVAIPQRTFEVLKQNRTIGEDTDLRHPGQALPVREVQGTAVMSSDVAKSLANWLLLQVATLERLAQGHKS